MKVIANTAINISWLSLNWLLLSSHLHFAISDSGMITKANSGVFFWYPGGNKPPISHHSGLLEYKPPQPIPSIPSVGSSSFSHIFFLWQLPISAMTCFFFFLTISETPISIIHSLENHEKWWWFKFNPLAKIRVNLVIPLAFGAQDRGLQQWLSKSFGLWDRQGKPTVSQGFSTSLLGKNNQQELWFHGICRLIFWIAKLV